MTINSLAKALEAAGIENALAEAYMLCGHFTGLSREKLILDRNAELDSVSLENAVRRRIAREPLQYILGEWEFFGLPFFVENTLIPRPETEFLTQFIIDNAPGGAQCADICCGGGCIAVAALTHRRDIRVTAADISCAALATAEKNAARHNVSDRVSFIEADVAAWQTDSAFDIIVSNPPYISAAEMDGCPAELAFEPRLALTDDGDGLSVISAVLRFISLHLKDGGLAAVEIGEKQGGDVTALADALKLSFSVLPDLAQKPRYVLLKHSFESSL